MTNHTAENARRRRWPWLLAGLVLGAAVQPLLTVVLPRHPDRYVLTGGLDADANYFFKKAGRQAPIRGALAAGTEFEVEMKKGPAWYIALRTVVDGNEVRTLCNPPIDHAAFHGELPRSDDRGWLSNPRVNAPVRPVTALAKNASAAPVRPARYAQRWADEDRRGVLLW